MTRRGARVVTVVAFASMLLIGIEAAARAQQTGSASHSPRVDADGIVAAGVTVSGVQVGGLTADEARQRLARFAARPVVVAFRGKSWRYAPKTLGAEVQVDSAVQAALDAPKQAALDLSVTVNEKRLGHWTRTFAKSFDRKPRNATIFLKGARPRATDAQFGRALSSWSAGTALLGALETHERTPVQLPVLILRPKVTRKNVGFAIVIKRASNRLILYRPGGPKGMRVHRRFGVATGQAAYPTPVGSFEIVSKQRNPWWYPPDSDWAEGAEPIPPGPGNPLGTRWMGLSTPAVGIHGTPDSASIGYSASHGCIRMHVPEAEWLFQRVKEGTPVYIVDA